MPEKKTGARKPAASRAASGKDAKETEVVVEKCHDSSNSAVKCGAGGGAVYGLGLVGAAVYYIQESSGFGEFLVACLKALVWPAFVVYDLLKHLA